MAADHSSDVFHHVRDSLYFELPFGIELTIPQPFGEYFHITKFMLLEVLAGVLVLLIYQGLAAHIASGRPAAGRFWNFWELLAVYIRDNVVRPTIGDSQHGHGDHGHGDHAHAGSGSSGPRPLSQTDAGHPHPDAIGGYAHTEQPVPGPADPVPHGAHPADRYLPYIWTVFFFVLFCNLLGAIPGLGSPTGNLWVTGVFALATFVVVLRSGFEELGVVGFFKALVPGMDLPGPMAFFLIPLIWVIEALGLMIKHGVLAVRLFANIMAGHTVIAVMLSFIAATDGMLRYGLVAPASIAGQVGIGLLELFVAFLQAYIFAFLSTLFISSAVHPH